MAATGNGFPNRLQAVLPPLYARVRRKAMLRKQQTAFRFEYTPELRQCSDRIGNGAQRVGAHDIVNTGVVQRDGFGGQRKWLDIQIKLGQPPFGQGVPGQ